MLQKIITNGLEKLGGSACPDPDRIVINDDNVLNYHGVHACGAACASTCYLLDGAWYNNQHTAVQLQLLHLFGALAGIDRMSRIAPHNGIGRHCACCASDMEARTAEPL